MFNSAQLLPRGIPSALISIGGSRMRRQKIKSSWITATMAALALFAIGAFSTAGYAQVKPGDFITPENATKVKDLVGPGVYYKVEHGMSMKIAPTQRVDWPPPYKDATEKYSAQVRLSQDKRSVVGYVAGQPFPLIRISKRPAATGCSASIQSSRPRKFVAPASSAGVTPIPSAVTISGASAP